MNASVKEATPMLENYKSPSQHEIICARFDVLNGEATLEVINRKDGRVGLASPVCVLKDPSFCYEDKIKAAHLIGYTDAYNKEEIGHSKDSLEKFALPMCW